MVLLGGIWGEERQGLFIVRLGTAILFRANICVCSLQFKAAKYYRLAEDNGNKTLGNSW